MADTATFYDAIAASYHNIFPSWEKTMYAQGGVLSEIIRKQNPRALSVRDCTCGIGTQAIGLAQLGFAVTASDISEQSVARAEREAAARGVNIDFSVGEVLSMDEDPRFDVVFSLDNAVAHMQTVEDLRLFMKSLLNQGKSGATLMLSVRDYEPILLERPSGTVPQLREHEGESHAYVQLWRWIENEPRYEATLLLLDRLTSLDWRVAANATGTFRAWTIDEIRASAIRAGWSDVAVLDAVRTGFHQPIIIGTRPA